MRLDLFDIGLSLFFLSSFFLLMRALTPLSPDGGPPVSPQVPAPAPCGGGERGRHGGQQPARKSADFHLHGDAVHRRHRLPEHRCTSLTEHMNTSLPIRLPFSHI